MRRWGAWRAQHGGPPRARLRTRGPRASIGAGASGGRSVGEITVGELLVRCLRAEGIELIDRHHRRGAHPDRRAHGEVRDPLRERAPRGSRGPHRRGLFAHRAQARGRDRKPCLRHGQHAGRHHERPRRRPPHRGHRHAAAPHQERPESGRRLAGGRHREHGAPDHEVRRHGAAVGAAARDDARGLPRRDDRAARARPTWRFPTSCWPRRSTRAASRPSTRRRVTA